MVQKGGVKSLLILLVKSIDVDAQRFAALAMGNAASAGELADILFLTYYYYLYYRVFKKPQHFLQQCIVLMLYL